MVTELQTCVNVVCSSDKVQAVMFASRSKQLVSAGDDRIVAFWNLDVKRLEVGVSTWEVGVSV